MKATIARVNPGIPLDKMIPGELYVLEYAEPAHGITDHTGVLVHAATVSSRDDKNVYHAKGGVLCHCESPNAKAHRALLVKRVTVEV